MNPTRMRLTREIGRDLMAVVVLAVASATSVEGQVGLSSGLAQVTLIARAAPKLSFPAVSRPREAGRQGNLTSAVVSVRFSANGAHRLVVRSSQRPGSSRVWVRGVDGVYRELVAGSSVTVAEGAGSAAETERQVSYRIDSPRGEKPLQLPVRYDLVMDPAL